MSLSAWYYTALWALHIIKGIGALSLVLLFKIMLLTLGAGSAQWLEHQTRDWKVSGSSPDRSGRRTSFSTVDFMCWLLFRYPFRLRVTAVAGERFRSVCQKCRWQVAVKHACALHASGFTWSGVTLCMIVWCIQNAPRPQQFHVAPAM